VAGSTSLKVSFGTKPLKLDGGDLSVYPFIYMTGHRDFRFSDAEVAALRRYLKAGGFLMADACCGRQAAIVQEKVQSPGPPHLEGITVNGELAVVYSPYDMGCGWELKPHPYAVGYEARDAIKLGVNIVVYACTH